MDHERNGNPGGVLFGPDLDYGKLFQEACSGAKTPVGRKRHRTVLVGGQDLGVDLVHAGAEAQVDGHGLGHHGGAAPNGWR